MDLIFIYSTVYEILSPQVSRKSKEVMFNKIIFNYDNGLIHCEHTNRIRPKDSTKYPQKPLFVDLIKEPYS